MNTLTDNPMARHGYNTGAKPYTFTLRKDGQTRTEQRTLPVLALNEFMRQMILAGYEASYETAEQVSHRR